MSFSAPIGVSVDHLTIKTNETFWDKFVTVVEGNERAELVPKMVKGSFQGMMNFEAMLAYSARKMSENGDVGLWDFAKTNNGKSLIMYPASEDSFFVSNANNYSECRVDSRIFGIMASLIMLNQASWHFHGTDEVLSQTFAELYHALRNAFYDASESIVYDPESTETEEVKEQVRAMSQAVTAFLD